MTRLPATANQGESLAAENTSSRRGALSALGREVLEKLAEKQTRTKSKEKSGKAQATKQVPRIKPGLPRLHYAAQVAAVQNPPAAQEPWNNTVIPTSVSHSNCYQHPEESPMRGARGCNLNISDHEAVLLVEDPGYQEPQPEVPPPVSANADAWPALEAGTSTVACRPPVGVWANPRASPEAASVAAAAAAPPVRLVSIETPVDAKGEPWKVELRCPWLEPMRSLDPSLPVKKRPIFPDGQGPAPPKANREMPLKKHVPDFLLTTAPLLPTEATS